MKEAFSRNFVFASIAIYFLLNALLPLQLQKSFGVNPDYVSLALGIPLGLLVIVLFVERKKPNITLAQFGAALSLLFGIILFLVIAIPVIHAASIILTESYAEYMITMQTLLQTNYSEKELLTILLIGNAITIIISSAFYFVTKSAVNSIAKEVSEQPNHKQALVGFEDDPPKVGKEAVKKELRGIRIGTLVLMLISGLLCYMAGITISI